MNKRYKIILSSNSPRRKELLAGLNIPFEIRVIEDIDETYPKSLNVNEIAQYISKKKAEAYHKVISDDELVITADTVVIKDDMVMGKPIDRNEAQEMLHRLGGGTHQVITGVCLTSKDFQRCFSVTTDVTFKTFTDEEINYYIDNYRPFDKAGAYGIQEWIGYIGVTALNGSYFNVMGLPVQRIYEELKVLGQI